MITTSLSKKAAFGRAFKSGRNRIEKMIINIFIYRGYFPIYFQILIVVQFGIGLQLK